MFVQGVPPTPPALVQPAPIRVAAWSLPQLGPDDVTLDCQMSLTAPLVARHFQIRYSTSVGRAAIDNFHVEGGPSGVIFAKINESSATRLEMRWAIPDLLVPNWAVPQHTAVTYTGVVSLSSQQIFIVRSVSNSWYYDTTPQSRGTCQVVP